MPLFLMGDVSEMSLRALGTGLPATGAAPPHPIQKGTGLRPGSAGGSVPVPLLRTLFQNLPPLMILSFICISSLNLFHG